MMHIQPRQNDGERGNTFSCRGCMVGIRDASYIFQAILVKDTILAYISFFEKKIALYLKRVCPFKA